MPCKCPPVCVCFQRPRQYEASVVWQNTEKCEVGRAVTNHMQLRRYTLYTSTKNIYGDVAMAT
jgi:hypothetical protein